MQSARGEDCLIRVPGYCSGIAESTVGCHYSLAGYFGRGLKAPGFMIAYGCFGCHCVVDFRINAPEFTRAEIKVMHLEGVLRTQAKLIDKGLMVIK